MYSFILKENLASSEFLKLQLYFFLNKFFYIILPV